jgi:hypothetical protein
LFAEYVQIYTNLSSPNEVRWKLYHSAPVISEVSEGAAKDIVLN